MKERRNVVETETEILDKNLVAETEEGFWLYLVDGFNREIEGCLLSPDQVHMLAREELEIDPQMIHSKEGEVHPIRMWQLSVVQIAEPLSDVEYERVTRLAFGLNNAFTHLLLAGFVAAVVLDSAITVKALAVAAGATVLHWIMTGGTG